MAEHYSIGWDEDDEGFWSVACKCGFSPGMFPTVEDACDALMDHARSEGRAEVGEAAKGASRFGSP